MTQYSKRMVIAHWLTLGLLVLAWYLGDAAHDARHEKVATLMGYIMHIAAGVAVLLLTLTRLVFRSKDKTPAPAGSGLLNKVATGMHHLLYVILIFLPISGAMQVVTSDVGKALLAGDVTLLPKKFTGVVAHEVHEILVTVLIVLVVVHILAALKHQFLDKDNLMSRMSLRRKD